MQRTNIEYVSIDDLKPYEKNPRKNDDAVEKVAKSIEEFGFKVPMVVAEDGTIIAGHTRLKAAKQLGMKEVPVIYATDLTDEQIKAFRIADNKTGELAEWDEELLAQELEELDDLFTGFDKDEISSLLGEELEDENPYTDKVQTPHYEVTGEEPELEELYDTSKTDMLIEEIMHSNVESEAKKFLIEAAKRHTVFNYKNIAEFYAHAEPEVQELMERSALVIIDYEDAIHNGFVSLNEDILEMMEDAEE